MEDHTNNSAVTNCAAGIWVTGYGEKLDIGGMSTYLLRNAITTCKRKEYLAPCLPFLEGELNRRLK